MKIIPADQPTVLPSLVTVLWGVADAGKTSLALTAPPPLVLIDCDKGHHRAMRRSDVVIPSAWPDLLDTGALEGFSTIVVDTAGAAINMLIDYLGQTSPELLQADGSPTLKLFGAAKVQFRRWVDSLRATGANLVLVAHAKEERGDGDLLLQRLDIVGAARDWIPQMADMIGYMTADRKGRRWLDFSPTRTRPGKNPCRWDVAEVPPNNAQYLAWLTEEAGKVINRRLGSLPSDTFADQLTAEAKALSEADAPAEDKQRVMARANAAGLVWSTEEGRFRA